MILRTPAKILIMGLPNSGKTTLARALLPYLPAVHWNGDALRACEWADPLGWSVEARWAQARRMKWLADQTIGSGISAICDFICPRIYSRELFAENQKPFVIWCERPAKREPKYANTYAIWQAPGGSGDGVDLHLKGDWDRDQAALAVVALLNNKGAPQGAMRRTDDSTSPEREL